MPTSGRRSRPNWDCLRCASCALRARCVLAASATGTSTGDLGATVVQPCGVTLEPVTTRIEEPVLRRFLPGLPDPVAGEAELPEDVDAEPLGATIDPAAVMAEALALALPAFPRAPGAELGEAVFTAPGTAPMRAEDAKPLAGLAALRDRLKGD
jgi:uncharacterized metal-binding protein YceD (DUF177 family)